MAKKPSGWPPLIRLSVLVEGETEEKFVKSVLLDHFRSVGIEATPILIGRARTRVGGGGVSIERVVRDMVHLYHSFDVVTSLVDFYGFSGKGDRTVEELEQHLTQEIEARIHHNWDPRKMIPYVQKYEFEGLLFSDVTVFMTLIDAPSDSLAKLQRIREEFPTPEEINDSSDTAPSKRIKEMFPKYQKPVDGPLLTMEIGLANIRSECPRFDAWVTRLESLT